jgi:hypothetical protein
VTADYMTSKLICGLPTESPQLLVIGDPSMFGCAGKKACVFNNPSGSNDFFVVKACTHMRVRVQQLNQFEFEQYKRRLVPDSYGHGEFESGLEKTKR